MASYELPVQLGQWLQVNYMEGHPFESMYLQLVNVPVISRIQKTLQNHYAEKINQSNLVAVSSPKIGSLYCVRWHQDDCFYRAKVLDDSPLVVLFVDYGNADQVESRDVFTLDEEFVQDAFQAVHCRLCGDFSECSQYSMTTQQRESILSLIKMPILFAQFFSNPFGDPPYLVELLSFVSVSNFVKEHIVPRTCEIKDSTSESSSCNQKISNMDSAIVEESCHSRAPSESGDSVGRDLVSQWLQNNPVEGASNVDVNNSTSLTGDRKTEMTEKTSLQDECSVINVFSVKYFPVVVDQSYQFEFILLEDTAGSYTPDNFFVLFCADVSDSHFSDTVETIRSLEKHFPTSECPKMWSKTVEALRPGTLLAVESEGIWHRAELVRCLKTSQQLEVLFIDRGQRDVLHYRQARLLPQKFSHLPRLAIPARVRNIRHKEGRNSFTADAIHFFIQELKKQEKLQCEDPSKIPLEISFDVVLPDNQCLPIEKFLVESGEADYIVSDQKSLLEWDPAHSDFFSERNNLKTNPNDVSAFSEQFLNLGASNTKICRFFRAHGKCQYGLNCRFLHDQSEQGSIHHDSGIFSTINFRELPPSGIKLFAEVIAAKSPSSFWIILPFGNVDLAKLNDSEASHVSFEDSQLSKLVKDMTDHYLRIKHPDFKTPFLPGELVAVRSKKDVRYYRGRVVDVLSDTDYRVFFVDFGFTEIVTTLDIRTIEPQFLHLSFQAYECCIGGISPLSDMAWSEKACSFFIKTLSSSDLFVVEIQDNSCSQLSVDLFLSKKNDNVVNVGEVLLQSGVAKREFSLKSSGNFPG